MLAAAVRDAAPLRLLVASCARSRGHARRIADARVVDFGKYRGQTFEEVLRQDKRYGDWVVRASMLPDSSPGLREFGEFVQEQASKAPEMMMPTQFRNVSDQGKSIAEACRSEDFENVGVGDKLVGFGKHRDQTFEDVLQKEKTFCAWVLRTSTKPDTLPALREFAAFLQARAPELMVAQETEVKGNGASGSDGVLTFGKYRGQTFEEVMQKDNGFCSWVLRSSDKPGSSPGLREFARFLQARAPELMVSHDTEFQGDGASGSDGVLTFGKYRGQSYEEVLQRDPDWCQWVLRAAENPENIQKGQGLLAFAEFLRSGGELGQRTKHESGDKAEGQ